MTGDKEDEEEGTTKMTTVPKRVLKDETDAEKRKKLKNIKLLEIIFLALIAIVIAAYAINYYDQNYNQPPTPVPPVVKPADVQLYKFLDLFGTLNVTQKKQQGNIELWLLNIGGEPAKNISVYVRVRNQNGTLLFNRTIDMTTILLRANETCTGDYSLLFTQSKPIHLWHTIEIQWDGGRNTYLKESNVN